MNNRNSPLQAGWLDDALDEYFRPPSCADTTLEQLPMAFEQDCQAAARHALEIEQMGRERPKLVGALSSLRDHFCTLAQLAGVKIDELFRYLNIARADEPDTASAWGLARLAHFVGMSQPEAELRLRLGFALGHRTPGATALAAELVPSYMQRAARPAASKVEPLLRACEASYSAARRERLRAASAVLASAFAEEKN